MTAVRFVIERPTGSEPVTYHGALAHLLVTTGQPVVDCRNQLAALSGGHTDQIDLGHAGRIVRAVLPPCSRCRGRRRITDNAVSPSGSLYPVDVPCPCILPERTPA